MKGLGWYSGIVVTISVIACFINVVQGMDISSNIWAIALYAPVVSFFVLYLKDKK
jgi:hypothetical protein